MDTQEKEEEYLHCVIVKKPIYLGLARKKAQEWIQNWSKRFYKETEVAYWFKCISAHHFKHLRRVEIDDQVSLIVGTLR